MRGFPFCCFPRRDRFNEAVMGQIDKNVGNIKNSHKSLVFTGLVDHKAGSLLYYLSSKEFSDEPTARTYFENVLEKIMSFKAAQRKIQSELGFDMSREVSIKGNNSVAILVEVTNEFSLCFFFEMNDVKVEFFDCDGYLATIDDLVVTLIEILNQATEEENGGANNSGARTMPIRP